MKEFITYYFDRPLQPNGKKMWFPLNYSWTSSTLLFVVLFIYGGISYKAPMFYVLSLVPFILLVYNILTEWYNFKQDNSRNLYLAYISYGSCAVIILFVITMLMLFSK